MRRKVLLFLLLLASPVPLAAEAATCSRYAGPAGAAVSIPAFWEEAVPGSTLCLRPGIYRGEGAMLVPPAGLSGARGAPITIRAIVDGTVGFDGEGVRSTLSVSDSSFIEFEGIDVYNSSVCSVCLDNTEEISLRRVVAWRDPGDTESANTMVVSVSKSRNILLEDLGCFGNGRKCVQIYRSVGVTARRVWARWDDRDANHTSGNEFAFSGAYRSYDTLAENILATSSSLHPVWLLATDWFETTGIDTAYWNLSRAPNDTRYRLLGSAAYSTRPHLGLLAADGQVGLLLRDVAISVAPESVRTALLHPCEGCTVAGLTTIGGNREVSTLKKIANNWNQSRGTTYYAQRRADIYTPADDAGAQLCFETVDGSLTSVPLWPWRMNERILSATQRSAWGSADVTQEVEGLFGPIPPECLR